MPIVAQPPDDAPPKTAPVRKCDQWLGAERRFCGTTEGVRRFLPGYRCPLHTPSAHQGLPEPEPGPGWPIYRGGCAG